MSEELHSIQTKIILIIISNINNWYTKILKSFQGIIKDQSFEFHLPILKHIYISSNLSYLILQKKKKENNKNPKTFPHLIPY